MAQNSTAYPFIGEVATERAGILVLPAVDSALFVAPTETWSHFTTHLSTLETSGGTVTLVSGGIGYYKHAFNGTVYRTPCFVNS